MVSIVGAYGRTPRNGRAKLAPTCKARKSATPQMDLLRNHQFLFYRMYTIPPGNGARVIVNLPSPDFQSLDGFPHSESE